MRDQHCEADKKLNCGLHVDRVMLINEINSVVSKQSSLKKKGTLMLEKIQVIEQYSYSVWYEEKWRLSYVVVAYSMW